MIVLPLQFPYPDGTTIETFNNEYASESRVKKTTPEKKKILKEILSGQNFESFNKRTVKSLLKDGLLTSDGVLTPKGSLAAIASMSLKNQCDILDIPIETAEWNGIGSPEDYVKSMYESGGYKVCRREGIQFDYVLRALCLETLSQMNLSPYGSCETRRENITLLMMLRCFAYCNYDLTRPPWQAPVKQDKNITEKFLIQINNEVITKDRENFIKTCQEIINTHNKYNSLCMLDLDIAVSMFDNIPKSTFLEVVSRAFETLDYSNGWPDITIANGKHVKFIEVKTTDKLQWTQIITMSSLLKDLDLEVSVLRLVKKE